MHLAGLANVLDGQQGYKPLSPEAIGALAPDLIIVTRESLQASGGLEGFARLPGIAVTQAAAKQRIIVMDDLLILGLGPVSYTHLYGVVDLMGYWRPTAVKGLQVQAGVFNLFDKKYWEAINVPTCLLYTSRDRACTGPPCPRWRPNRRRWRRRRARCPGATGN